MKKNLLLLCTILVTLSFFNSCSDDDKNQEWENLPSGPIQSDKVSIDLNGTATSGTVTLKATSNEAAQLQFQNVIPGYSDVTVDVKMVKQPDNSFTFSGTKDIATAPTKAEATPVFLTVTVNGTIAVDGKVTVNIATSGLGTYIGTYSGTTLKLMYGDSELTGKSVVFDATQPQDASIKLTDVIPGDTVTLLTGIQLNDNGFSGSSTTTAGKVDYTGALKDKVLTLNLNATMNDPQGWAKKYELGDMELIYSEEDEIMVPVASACYSKIEGENAPFTTWFNGLLGGILPQVINTITLQPDGNICAKYSSDTLQIPAGADIIMWVMGELSQEDINKIIENRKWIDSPKNLAYWYEKNNKLYVKLNIPAILAQTMKDNSGQSSIDLSSITSILLNSDAVSLKRAVTSLLTNKIDPEIITLINGIDNTTLTTLLDWMKNGIPLNVASENGHTAFYLDYNQMDMFIKILSEALPVLFNMLPPDMADAKEMLQAIIEEQFIGSWSLTTRFDLGLNLIAKQN